MSIRAIQGCPEKFDASPLGKKDERDSSKVARSRGRCNDSRRCTAELQRLFVLAAGIAASRCVPLFNPINNRLLSQPRTVPHAKYEHRDAAGEILRRCQSLRSVMGLPRWESPRGHLTSLEEFHATLLLHPPLSFFLFSISTVLGEHQVVPPDEVSRDVPPSCVSVTVLGGRWIV